MFMTTRFRPARLLAVLATSAAAMACDASGSVSPTTARQSTSAVFLSEVPRGVDLGSCTHLAVDPSERVSAHFYAIGTQNYFWNGSTWLVYGPQADLFAAPGGQGKVGVHYAGPTWLATSGSGVIGRLADSCTPDANSIPWLLLSVVSSRGPGIFEGTTHIQRVNTVGGLMPTSPGTTYGDVMKVPYTAEYIFYR
jgi:hypothetical protein